MFQKRRPPFAALLLVMPGLAMPAEAGQTLIPSPYPVTVPGAQPLDPDPGEIGGPQTLNRDPYPQLLGNGSQGNPPIARRHRSQHLVPSLSERKYKVDRP